MKKNKANQEQEEEEKSGNKKGILNKKWTFSVVNMKQKLSCLEGLLLI